MRPPRSPRTKKLLDSLEAIYASGDATPSEKLQAAKLASSIMAGKKKPAKPKSKSRNVTGALAQIRKLQNEGQR
jgi:hypothetical protein